ncbi:hypothetical protein PAXRUDRAFT_153340, partial [Paxillus rubicundulus Ve08.2h10]
LEGTWLDHPSHPQNIIGILKGPVGKTDVFIDKTLVSIVKGLNIPIVTDTYNDNDNHLSHSLIHHQAYEKSSIGSKYNIHPFQFTINTLDFNNLHEDNISQVWDVPTIQKRNEVMDGIIRRRYWADPSRLPAHHQVLARRSEMLATKLRENTLFPYLQKQSYDQITVKIDDIITENSFGYKRIQREYQKILEIIPDLIKMPVYPLTTLPHWMHDLYTIRDLLYPEAVYQEVTSHEILTWGHLNSLDTSRIIFPYANGQNILNKIHLINSDDVTVLNSYFFLILNFHILESNNNCTWPNTYIFLSLFVNLVFPVQSNLDLPHETEAQEASTSYQPQRKTSM